MDNTKTKNIASPTLRLFAFLIDILARLLIFLLIIGTVFSASSTDKILTSLLSSAILIVIVNTIIFPLVQVYLTSKLGGSIGKLICGIKIVDEEGNLLNLKRAFFRNYLGYIVSATFLHLGFIWILVNKEKHRAWHDLISNTWVVTKSNRHTRFVTYTIFTILLTINIFLGFRIYQNIVSNFSFYETITNETKTEIDVFLKNNPLFQNSENLKTAP